MGLIKSPGPVSDLIGKKPQTVARVPVKQETPNQEKQPKAGPIPTQAEAKTPDQRKAKTRTQSKPQSRKQPVNDKKKTTLSISVLAPAPGVNARYDEIVRVEDETVAMGYILTQALDEFAEIIAENAIDSGIEDYEKTDFEFSTKRRFNSNLYEKAREHFDPLGVKKPFFISNKIAQSALNLYFSKADQ